MLDASRDDDEAAQNYKHASAGTPPRIASHNIGSGLSSKTCAQAKKDGRAATPVRERVEQHLCSPYSARSTLLQRLSGYSSSSMHRTGSSEVVVELQPPSTSQTLSTEIDPRNCCRDEKPEEKTHSECFRRGSHYFDVSISKRLQACFEYTSRNRLLAY